MSSILNTPIKPFFSSIPADFEEELLNQQYTCKFIMELIDEIGDAEDAIKYLIIQLQEKEELLILSSETGEILQEVELSEETLNKTFSETIKYSSPDGLLFSFSGGW